MSKTATGRWTMRSRVIRNDDIGEEVAAQAVPHAAHHPPRRAARLRSLPAEPGEGHEPPVARAGGGRGRLCRRHAPRRPELLHLSRPRAHAGARRVGREGARRAHAARQRADARQGRIDAPHLRRARRDGLLRHHRRAPADRLRRGVARAIQGTRRCVRLLLRRRHDEYRRVPRGAEFRGGVEAAGRLRLREQPLHGIHADPQRDRGRASRRRTAPAPTASSGSSSTATTPTRSIAPRRPPSRGTRRQGALADRMPDLPPQRPFARRPRKVPAAR